MVRYHGLHLVRRSLTSLARRDTYSIGVCRGVGATPCSQSRGLFYLNFRNVGSDNYVVKPGFCSGNIGVARSIHGTGNCLVVVLSLRSFNHIRSNFRKWGVSIIFA